MAMGRGNVIAVVAALGVILIAVVGSLLMNQASAPGEGSAGTTQLAQATTVRTVEMVEESVAISFESRGFVRGFEEVTVHAEVDGRVMRRPIDEGSQVRKGELLYQIDTTFLDLAVKQLEASLQAAKEQLLQAKAGFDSARAQVAEAEAAHQNAINEFKRIERLRRSDTAMPVEVDRITTAKRQAEARMRMANAALSAAESKQDAAKAACDLAEAQLEEARERLRRCEIVSPIDGVVSMVAIDAGEYVRPTQPVCEVIRVDKLKLTVEVSDREAVRLKVGTAAGVHVDALPEETFEGTVVRIGPRANPQSKRFPVELHVPNPDGRLLAGMFCRGVLPAGRLDDVMLIPRESVVEKFGGTFCYVVEPSEDGAYRVAVRRITTRNMPGRSARAQVVSGLKVGDRVVTTGAEQLRDGQSVCLAPEEELASRNRNPQIGATP